MTKVLLCVDLSYQVYRAAAAHPLLTCRHTFTGGLYGFLTTFAKAVRETGATRVAFGRDVKPYRRSLVYPEYKQLRRKTRDDGLLELYSASMPLVLEAIEACGHVPWGVEGFEFDDLAGHAARQYRHRFDRIYAQSNDSDLYQLLDVPNFAVYRDSLKDAVTAATLRRDSDLAPDECVLFNALQGTHNDVEGIPNVGPVTARRALREPAVMRQMRERWGAVIDRNVGLIRLPHPDFPAGEPLPVPRRAFASRDLVRFCSKYDIETTGAMLRAFEQLDV